MPMPSNAKPKIDWLVPYPIKGSGGHRTILAHVRDLVRRGYECVIHVQERDPHDPNSSACSPRELEKTLNGYFFPTGARVVASWERPEPCDIRMATAWESAYAVHRSPHAKRKGYFVQDFEAWFSAMGDGYIGAENSYRLGLECITIGRFLTHLIASRYKGHADYFDFTADNSLYFAGEGARAPSPTVAFLYQPEKPRRCPWLGRETLGIVKHRMPEAKILLYGSPEAANLWFEHENLKLVSPARCAALYRQAWVGLCISASNPSRIPFEMMASGCAVVDIARENNAFDYEPGAIVLAEPRPEALADAIVRLLQNGELRERQVRAGLDMMATRQDQRAFDRVEELILRLHETGTVRDSSSLPQPRPLNLDPALSIASAGESCVPQPHPRETATERTSKARRQVKRVRDLGRRLDARLRTALAERGKWPTASYATLWKELSPLLDGRRAVAFDVFDTILVRRVAPEAIKELVAHEAERLLRPHGVAYTWLDLLGLRADIERDLCLKNQRAGLDDEFDYETMLADWLDAAGAPSDRRGEMAAALRAHEEQMELAAQETHPAIPPVLARLREKGLDLIFVSDFYLPVETLWRFLDAAQVAHYFKAGYCSATGKLRKASGRLYQHVLQDLRLQPGELLMVGDNIHSDVRRALDVGVQSIHLRDPAALKRRMQLEMLRRLARRNPYWRGALAEAVIDSSVHLRPPAASESYQLGQTLAPAFVSFVEAILEHAEREAVPAVYFCAREGLTFYRMARALRRRRGAGPELRYIGVSRKATFLPSMAGLNRAELDRFLQQYATLSGRQLLDSLSLPIEIFGARLVAAGLEDLDAPVEGMADSPALARFLDDPVVQSMYAARHSEARQLFAEYLRQERFFKHPRVLIVDIGWKGSIIDNLVRAVRHIDDAPAVSALLFGAQEQASNEVCTKHGYFFHGPERDVFAQTGMTNVALFEIHATAGHGSVDGYTRRGNRVRPVLRTVPEERDAWRETVQEGQRAVRGYFRRYLSVHDLLRSTYDTSVEEWRPYQQDCIRRLVHYPTRSEVDAFMRMKHVESFGVFSVRHFAKERPIFQRNGDQPRLLPRLGEIYRSVRWTVWPAGIMGRLGLSWLNPVYDVVDTWHRTHRY